MYNKLFTKILDSTIWLEPDATRLVWITFLAMMDEDGHVPLSSIGNVASRARVSIEDATQAIYTLEAPDKQDTSQEHEGRRIEKVPGGWVVLNAARYREIVSREESRRLNRDRQSRYREKQRNAAVTHSNAAVTHSNARVTQSEAVSEAYTESKEKRKSKGRAFALPDWIPEDAWKAWLEIRPKVKAPNTPRALDLAVKELAKLKDRGQDPRAVLEQSTLRGWRGLFEVKTSVPDYSGVR